jgi:hypothetical protein
MSNLTSVRVICRFRPINQREIDEGEKSGIDAQLDFPSDKGLLNRS